MKYELVDKGICAPLGFMAAGVSANINKKGNSKKDLALIFSQIPAKAAAVFTKNVVKAAPILVTQQHIKKGLIQAIVINSRIANACTGKQGINDAYEMCSFTAQTLRIKTEQTAVASTGIIGQLLPMDLIKNGILAAASILSREGDPDAAVAILTTDTYSKESAVKIKLDSHVITIGGIAKGSGMVHPNMGTMLGFITTDANISLEALQMALKRTNATSFNMISVDGDTSTNDMVLIMANGLAANPEIQIDSPSYEIFCEALEMMLIYLAKKIARDGEGATKLFEVRVKGAKTVEDARVAARAVSKSLLVKAALFGNDANWGRILCAIGYSGAIFDPSTVNLFIGNIQVMQNGTPLPFDEKQIFAVIDQSEVIVTANLHYGNASATAWGCDLSYDYVKINGSYRT